MPPPPPLVLFPLILLLLTFTTPEASLEMPPPLATEPLPKMPAELDFTSQLVIVTVPASALWMPAPVLLPEVDPSLIASPEKLTAPVVVTLKMRKFNDEPRRTVSLSAPGPVMAMLVLRSESGWLKLMMHFPVEASQLGSVAGIAKIIVSSPAMVFAASIAARKVHRPPRTVQFVKVPGSALLLTANTDPASGVTPS